MVAALETLQETEVWPCSYHNDGYRSGFLATVGDFQKAGVLQDVVLEVESRQFPCHRLVLSAASPYFRAMFAGKMSESRQKTVVLQGLNPAMFEEILSYIYSGTIHVSMENVQPLYQAADLLQVEYVRETCISYMARNVEHSTCLDLYKFADDFLVGTVRDLCLQYICRYFEQVSTTAEFCSLSVDRLTDIISQDWLDVKEETTVWEAVVRWVEHSTQDRKQHLPILLQHIRFNLVSSDDTEAILEQPLVREDPGSLRVIRNVVQRKASNLKIRAGMETQEMALLFSWNTEEMLCMNPRTQKYISCPVTGHFNANMDEVIAMTVTSSNDIYFLTEKKLRYRDDGRLSLLVYNHLRNMWVHQSSVYRFARDDHLVEDIEECLVEADGQLYYLAVSHRHKVDTIMRIKRHNHHTDQWAECSQLLIINNWNAQVGKAVSCGTHIYFITGREMHRYHPSKDQWCKMAAPIIYPYIDTAIGTTTEIFCESDDLGEMYLYDTVSDRWKKLPDWTFPQEEPYQNMESDYSVYFVLEGQLHLLTGFSNDVHSGTISYACQLCVLDRSKRVWTDLKVPLQHTCCLWRPNVHPVARMYLPCLNTNAIDVQNTANP